MWADRRVTERIPAPPIPKHDQLSEEAIELAALSRLDIEVEAVRRERSCCVGGTTAIQR